MVAFTAKLKQPSGVLIQQVPEGDSVLLHVASGQYFGLDPMGHVMWTKLVALPSVQAAYDELVSEYDVEPDRLRTDMVALIDELMANGLLETVET